MSLFRVTPLILALFLLPGHAAAQAPALEAGGWLLGGTVSLTSNGFDGSDDRQTVLILAPRSQYFVRPGLALGGEAQIRRLSSDGGSTTSYAVGPAATYHFVQDGTAHPFIAGSLRFGGYSSRSDLGGDRDVTYVGWEVGAGILFLLTEAVGIDTRLSYLREDRGELSDWDSYGLSIGVAAFLF